MYDIRVLFNAESRNSFDGMKLFYLSMSIPVYLTGRGTVTKYFYELFGGSWGELAGTPLVITANNNMEPSQGQLATVFRTSTTVISTTLNSYKYSKDTMS